MHAIGFSNLVPGKPAIIPNLNPGEHAIIPIHHVKKQPPTPFSPPIEECYEHRSRSLEGLTFTTYDKGKIDEKFEQLNQIVETRLKQEKEDNQKFTKTSIRESEDRLATNCETLYERLRPALSRDLTEELKERVVEDVFTEEKMQQIAERIFTKQFLSEIQEMRKQITSLQDEIKTLKKG